jgi:alkanesulfonate monooxygenase SsuD/methylene tetrahydromethanopterin reductase-like flavin-dependent oxidoreductase (luciferase family)
MQFKELKERILEAERLGFESFWLHDHLMGIPFPDRQPILEIWTTLSALSMVTSRIHLGTLCVNIQNRLPSLLAKMAATLDVISGGRLELGLGAGGTSRVGKHIELGYVPEYVAYGTSFSEKASTRIQQLEEATRIIKLMWTEEYATFSGEYYRIKDAVCNPKPVQKPHPRIWIAGAGPKVLEIAARHANGTNFGGTVTKGGNLAPAEFREKLLELKELCERVGSDYAGIRKSMHTGVLIAEKESQLSLIEDDMIKRYNAMDKNLNYFNRKSSLIGTPDQCAKKLREYAEIGVDYFLLIFDGVDQMRLFAEKVIPQFN